MSQQTRKRHHQQQSPPAVKEEQQEQEEDTTHSNGAGINGNQCSSSSNLEDSNTIGTAAGGNGGDDINQLKLKMAALETRNHLLEGKLEYQELHARIRETNFKQENTALWTKLKEVEENAKTDCKKMMDEFGQRLTALEAKHHQEIAGLKRNQQQQQPIAEMPDCVVVNMPPESQGTSNNSNKVQHNIVEQATMATVAALIPPKSVAPNSLPCHSAQQQQEVKEETKRLCNPLRNCWNQNSCKATMEITLPDQLTVHNSSPVHEKIIALKGFLVFNCRPLEQNHFAGPILYYYEITINLPLLFDEWRLCIGFSNTAIKKGWWSIGSTPNTYAIRDDKLYCCFLSGGARIFEWPARAVRPILHGCGDVFGCGLVLSPDDKLAIFFTTNGILMGKQFPIVHKAGSTILYPSVQLNRNVTVEANFGQKQFQYSIDKYPGLVFQW